MKRPNKEEYKNMLGDEKFIAYTKSLEDYCDYLEKNNKEVSKGLDNACEKLEAFRVCIDVLTDKESKKIKNIGKRRQWKMTKFELDLLKVVSSNGDGDECFEDVDVLIDMRMKGYYKDVDDGITVDELIERYENVD